MPQSSPKKRSFMSAFCNPATIRADILMSIMPQHINNIAEGKKNHEYRKYLLPSSVKRIWFYTSAPVSRVQYVAQVGRGRTPGQVPEDGGIGNEDFNAGRKVSKYGYEIQKLWRLHPSISLDLARAKGYLKGPPQKYNYAPASLLQDYLLAEHECIINRQKQAVGKENVGGELEPWTTAKRVNIAKAMGEGKGGKGLGELKVHSDIPESKANGQSHVSEPNEKPKTRGDHAQAD